MEGMLKWGYYRLANIFLTDYRYTPQPNIVQIPFLIYDSMLYFVIYIGFGISNQLSLSLFFLNVVYLVTCEVYIDHPYYSIIHWIS